MICCSLAVRFVSFRFVFSSTRLVFLPVCTLLLHINHLVRHVRIAFSIIFFFCFSYPSSSVVPLVVPVVVTLLFRFVFFFVVCCCCCCCCRSCQIITVIDGDTNTALLPQQISAEHLTVHRHPPPPPSVAIVVLNSPPRWVSYFKYEMQLVKVSVPHQEVTYWSVTQRALRVCVCNFLCVIVCLFVRPSSCHRVLTYFSRATAAAASAFACERVCRKHTHTHTHTRRR